MRGLCLMLTMMCSAALLAGCEALAQKTGISILGLPKPVQLAPEDSGTEVKLAHGQRMIVRLPKDAAMSGYEWAPREPASPAVMRESAPDSRPGEEIWTFTPVRSGREKLRLEYRQPRRPDAPPARTVSYDVAVP